jgi:hypothetical protein
MVFHIKADTRTRVGFVCLLDTSLDIAKLTVAIIPPLTRLIAEGRAVRIECIVRRNGEAPAHAFLTVDLEQVRQGKDKPEATAAAKFMALFRAMANYGQISGKRFKGEMEGFRTFKCEVKNLQIRFPCFRDGPAWILTHGFIKPGAQRGLGGWPAEEVKRAIALRSEYFARKEEIAKSSERRKR